MDKGIVIGVNVNNGSVTDTIFGVTLCNRYSIVTTYAYGSAGGVLVSLDVDPDINTLRFSTDLIKDGQHTRTYTTAASLKYALKSSKIDQVYDLDYSTIKDIGNEEFEVALVRKEEDDDEF